MQNINVNSWSDFKTIIAAKQLSIQFSEVENYYDVFAPEAASLIWAITLLKGTDDAIDFENNFKAAANSPLEIKGDPGKPIRVATSAQPMGTTESWKGYHHESAAGETGFVFDLGFDQDVWLRGGEIYSDDCNCEDSISADIVLKSDPTTIVFPKMLDTIYLMPNTMIKFLSSESMLLPSTLMLRATYTKKSGDTGARCLSAVLDFFKGA